MTNLTREQQRMVEGTARGVLFDALVTFLARMREEGLTGPDTGPALLDEWMTACAEVSVIEATPPGEPAASDVDLLLVAVLQMPDTLEDSGVEALIEQRRRELRSARLNAPVVEPHDA